MTIQEFCDKHKACSQGRRWALANCNSMQEAWDKCERYDWLLWIATRKGVLTDHELRTFALWCANSVKHLITDKRSLDCLIVVERFLAGQATQNELDKARNAAYAAYADAAYAAYADAAYAAAGAAGAAAYGAAAYGAAAAAADTADAAYAYAYATGAAAAAAAAAADTAADTYAADAAARQSQTNYLRTNFKPNFE